MELLILILVIAALGVYIKRTNRLTKQVAELEQRMDRLTPPALSPSVQQVSGAPAAVTPPAPRPTPAVAASEPLAAVPALPIAAAAPAPQPQAAPAPISRTREEWELLIGGKLLNRIGALALVLGVGFFLKYAFDNDWITETIRVLIGLIVGGGLLLGGERARRKGLEIFAQGLAGAGLAILYLSVYAAYNFYQLVTQPVALVAMSIVTILAFLQALRYNSLAISLLGWAGGFLTPFLLASDQATALGLLGYILLLDIGLVAVVIKRDSWLVLEFLTRGATYVVYGLWYVNAYTATDFWVAVSFLALFWGLFYLLHLAHVLRAGTGLLELRHLGALLNTLLFYAGLYNLVNALYPDWMGSVTLAAGMVYCVTALALMRRRPAHTSVHAQYMLTAIALLVLATALQFSSFITIIVWALEALALAWCGNYWKLSYVRYPALGIFGLALLQLLGVPGGLAYSPIAAFTPLLNERALAFMILALTLGASARYFRDSIKEISLDLPAWLHAGWSGLLLVLLTVETNDVFRYLMLDSTGDERIYLAYVRTLVIALLWMAYSLPLVWSGLRAAIPALMYVAIGAALAAVALAAFGGLSFDPLIHFTLLLNVRVGVMILIIGGLWLHARWLGQRPQPYMPRLWYVLSALLIFELSTAEARDFFERAIVLAQQENAWTTAHQLANLQQLAISGVWLLYATVLISLGFWRRVPALRIGAILLAGITILKIFVYDLAFLETLYRIFSFIGLGLILLGVSYLYQRYKAVIFGPPLQHSPG